MKIEPTFDFVRRGDNEALYDVEEKAEAAVKAVMAHRVQAFGEAEWTCALPEAIYVLIDAFDQDGVAKAVLHWIDLQLHPEKRPRNFGAAKPNMELNKKLLKLLFR